jgi:hypothetical protein
VAEIQKGHFQAQNLYIFDQKYLQYSQPCIKATYNSLIREQASEKALESNQEHIRRFLNLWHIKVPERMKHA